MLEAADRFVSRTLVPVCSCRSARIGPGPLSPQSSIRPRITVRTWRSTCTISSVRSLRRPIHVLHSLCEEYLTALFVVLHEPEDLHNCRGRGTSAEDFTDRKESYALFVDCRDDAVSENTRSASFGVYKSTQSASLPSRPARPDSW